MSRTRGSRCQRDCTAATESNVFVWSLSYSGRAPRGTPPPPWGASSWSLTVTVLLVMGETTPRDANSSVTSGEAAPVAFPDPHVCAVDVHALLPRRPGLGPGRCLSEDTTHRALPHGLPTHSPFSSPSSPLRWCLGSFHTDGYLQWINRARILKLGWQNVG